MTLGFGFRIEGDQKASGVVEKLPRQALRAIQSKASERANKTVLRLQREMSAEYTSAWATGLLARGITHKEIIRGNGVDVKFFIADRRELRYVTAALGGHFQHFPVGPFVIRPASGKALSIPLASNMRRFIRGARGQFAGSRPTEDGRILVKQVLWGKRSGGFPRDVISEVLQEESVLFVQDMTAAVDNVVVQLTQ